jgi:tetratricopeptide (TPR) repeat protein
MAYASRGDGYGMKGDFDRAIADASEAIRLNPKLARAYYSRGEAYRMKGDFGRAISNLTEALRLAPEYEWAKKQLEVATQDRARAREREEARRTGAEREQPARRDTKSGHLVLACPRCDKQLRVPQELIGSRVRCPGCQCVFRASPPKDEGDDDSEEFEVCCLDDDDSDEDFELSLTE